MANPKTVDQLTDEMKADIRRYYVTEKKTISATVYRTGLLRLVVSAYLKVEGLTRSQREISQTSPLREYAHTSVARARAGRFQGTW